MGPMGGFNMDSHGFFWDPKTRRKTGHVMTNDTPRYQGDDDETEEVTIVLTGKEG